MSKYEADNDVDIMWPTGGAPIRVTMFFGYEADWPADLWNGARAAALMGFQTWKNWNTTMHPNPVHRVWAASVDAPTLESARTRAIAIVLP